MKFAKGINIRPISNDRLAYKLFNEAIASQTESGKWILK
jgi:hypothetical protein